MDIAGIKPRKKISIWLKERVYKMLKFIINKIFKKKKDELIKKLRKKFASSDYSNLNTYTFLSYRLLMLD